MLVTGNSGKPYAFITRNRWIGKCLTSSNGGDGGLEVVSPEGIRYIFNRYGRVSGGSTANAFAFHPTRIEHPNGTAITITYKKDSGTYLRIDEISHSEGQTISFSYLDSTGSGARLNTISLDSQHTWTYDYTAESSVPGAELYYLTKVTRPDGCSFDYSYYASAGNGQYSLESIETPPGATVTYGYVSQTFPRHSEGAIPRIVVHSKQIGGAVDATGTWTYTYDPASSASEVTDTTEIDGPTNCVVYKHQSATTANDQLWRIGLLLEKSIRTSCSGSVLRREVYDWSSQTLAAQAYWRAPNVIDGDTWTPQLDSLTVTQDGSNYTTNYSNYDEWGNAHHVVESGQDSRTTDRTFVNDTSRWIVKRVEDETISNAGVVYPSAVTSNYNYTINRSYDTNGDLLSENRSGVTTDYSWYHSGASRGEINTVTDADNHTITYSNYKRGIAQNESHPLRVSVARVVANAGTVTSRTDAAGRTSTYSYNGVDDLTGVGTPKAGDDNISISRIDPSRPTLTRGTYQVVEDYDGLGNYRGSNVIDLAAARQINRLKLLDSEGRVSRLYLPVYAI